MLVPCPHCGPRPVEEFAFRHALPLPDVDAFGAVYLRTNSPSLSREYWQHVRGCRTWFVLARNPASGVIAEVQWPAGEM
ncbi:MAG: sarcosine oxidase subunit delta [Proteobacteria bacterium]|nr:sarcosine oxidase subunit delta [Pseudomonadota bacterium]